MTKMSLNRGGRWVLSVALLTVAQWVVAQSSDKQGQVAPELVGKWCYYNLANGDEGRMSNTCVNLNADGTYDFTLDGSVMGKVTSLFPGALAQQSDYGTWSAQGNVIFYNSTANGKGSFRIQKINQPQDKTVPMIVLNGLSFISATPRDPW